MLSFCSDIKQTGSIPVVLLSIHCSFKAITREHVLVCALAHSNSETRDRMSSCEILRSYERCMEHFYSCRSSWGWSMVKTRLLPGIKTGCKRGRAYSAGLESVPSCSPASSSQDSPSAASPSNPSTTNGSPAANATPKGKWPLKKRKAGEDIKQQMLAEHKLLREQLAEVASPATEVR